VHAALGRGFLVLLNSHVELLNQTIFDFTIPEQL